MSARTTCTGAQEPPWETLRRRLIQWEDEAPRRKRKRWRREWGTEARAWSDRNCSSSHIKADMLNAVSLPFMDQSHCYQYDWMTSCGWQILETFTPCNVIILIRFWCFWHFFSTCNDNSMKKMVPLSLKAKVGNITYCVINIISWLQCNPAVLFLMPLYCYMFFSFIE